MIARQQSAAAKLGPRNIIAIGGAVIAGLIAISVIGGSIYTIDEGERGVVLRNKEFTAVAEPGLGVKMPFVDDVRTISIRTQSLAFADEPVYTADRQNASVTFSINYAALPGAVEQIYRNYGSLEVLENRLLTRPAKEQIKNVFGQYTSETAIRERARLNSDLAVAINKLGNGVIRVESVQIENIDFSDVVEQAAEDRAKAEMLVKTKQQELERQKIENQIQVANAKAAADAQLAAAEAKAKAIELEGRARANNIRLQGEAEAAAIKAKSDALAASPNLVELTKAERWDGKLPVNFVPGSSVPFLNIK